MLSGNYFIADERTNYHSMVVDPLVTVHDSFSSLPIHSKFLLFLLKAYFERIYEAHDPLADFEEDITKIKVTKRKREYKLMLTNNPGAEVFS